MSREMTDDEAETCQFLSGVMAATAMTVRNTNFIKEMLDEALDFMSDEDKARFETVSSDITRARILLEYVLLNLALIDDDLDDESDDEVSEDDE